MGNFPSFFLLFLNIFFFTLPLLIISHSYLLEFIVDSRNLLARRSQNNIRPIPVPIVRIFPLNETLLIPQPELREGIFLTGCSVLLSNKSVWAWRKKVNVFNQLLAFDDDDVKSNNNNFRAIMITTHSFTHLTSYSVHLTVFISW